jgi:hypothetical protein
MITDLRGGPQAALISCCGDLVRYVKSEQIPAHRHFHDR